MKNKQEWFSIAELIELQSNQLPTSDKGISKKADREKWQKRQREGVKGKTFEYHYLSFPIAVQKALGFEPTEPQPTLIATQIEQQTQAMSRQELEETIKTLEALVEKIKVKQEPKEPIYTDLELSWVERRLIKDFRKCTEENQERILDMVEFTLERQEKKAREEVEDIERGLEVA